MFSSEDIKKEWLGCGHLKNNYQVLTKDGSQKIPLVAKSILVGAVAGVVVVAYRIALTKAEMLAFWGYEQLRENMVWIPVAILLLCAMGYLTGALVSRNKMISGSGIPQLEGIIHGHFQDRKSWLHTLCSKFIGGSIAIAGGLSLGREGPSIQLGASVAEGIGNKIADSRLERKLLMASGASAGLAAAFNAPLAGVIFSLEEIFKYFSPTILLSTMSAAVTADFISKQVFGTKPVFDFVLTQAIPLKHYWVLLVLGLFMGVMGSIYNWLLLRIQKVYKQTSWLNDKVKMMIPFLFALLFGMVFPVILGGGHRVIEELSLQTGLMMLCLIFVLKLFFSVVSFGSGAPGGIFFPLLVLGASLGGVFATILIRFLDFPPELFYNFVILAMAGYFTAIVRAPITGVVLIMEMTGSFASMLQLSIVALISYVVADLLKSPPIYDALLDNLVKGNHKEHKKESNRRIIIELPIQHGSKLEEKEIKDIEWPEKTLLVTVKRGEREILPQGDTLLKAGDHLSILTDVNHESAIREVLNRMNE